MRNHAPARAALALVLFASLTPRLARAQSCCSPATTPTDALEHAALPAGQMTVGLHAEHYRVSGGKRGTQSFAYPGDRRANAQVVTLAVHYGITSRISTGALVPFERRERSDLATTGERLSRSHVGLGDVALLGYFRLLPPLSPREWTVGAGAKLASGQSRAEDDSGELPSELQPGTGANDALLTTLYSQSLGKWTSSAALTWRITGTLTKVDVFPGEPEIRRRYRFGNELLYGLAAAWSPAARWGIELGIRGRHAEPDEGTRLQPDGSAAPGVERVPSTGGERLFLAPVLRVAFFDTGTTISAGALIPIYENMRGSQLAARTGFRVGVEGHP